MSLVKSGSIFRQLVEPIANENATNENATNENATNENATNENATNENACIPQSDPLCADEELARLVASYIIRSAMYLKEVSNILDENASKNYHDNFNGITLEIEQLQHKRDNLKKEIDESNIVLSNTIKLNIEKAIQQKHLRCMGYVITAGALFGSFLILCRAKF